MPVILTKEFVDHTFFIPLTADKSEGVWVKPLTETMRRKIRDGAIQEAGHDQFIAGVYVVRDTLKECISNWKGFRDKAEKEIPYSQDVLSELFKLDPAPFTDIYERISSVARFGELEEIKN